MNGRKIKLLLAEDSTWVDHVGLPVFGLFRYENQRSHDDLARM